ncbi:MAG: GerMN domain-containing protein [Syntrophomonas sp.]|nr:GerMN domain-containing protein [Syntrophomonas sp.]
MTKKLIVSLAAVLLVICLLSGGCSKVDESKIKAWKDLIKIPASTEKSAQSDKDILTPEKQSAEPTEKVSVKLYFEDAQQSKLVVEERSIGKVEGIARQTMQELIKGPSQTEMRSIFPSGTKLLDINVKPEGLCIVDLSGEAKKVSNKEQGKLMVQAIANTLGQFPSIREVSFLVNGEKVNNLGGMVDLTKPVQAEYNMSK